MNIPVSGASRYEQKIAEAPADVTIVTRDEIKKYGYRTLADILRATRGFYVTNDRNYSYVGVRGFNRPGDYNARILVLVDGHRINDNVYDSVLIGREFPVDIDLFDRVEIIRGPGSSLYGTNAFFAVINIITRRGGDVKGLEVSGEAGTFNTYKGRATYGQKFKGGLEVMASGSYLDSKGPNLFFQEFNAPATNSGMARYCDYESAPSLFGRLSFKDLTLTGVYHSRDKGVPTGAYGAFFNDPRTQTTDTRAFLDAKFERQFAGQWGLMARIYYDRYHYYGDLVFNRAAPGNPPDLFLNKDFSRGDWWGGEIQVSKKLMDRHKIIAGAEYRDNIQQNQGNFNENPVTVNLRDNQRSNIVAAYVQAELLLLKNLRLNAGVRHDQYSTFGGSTNPRAALIYAPFEKTNLKFIYGSAFRAPNVYELFYQDGGVTQKSNPDLKPEKITTYELVWEQLLGRRYRLVASGFIYNIQDLITQRVDPNDGLIVFNNIGNVEAKGVELELRGKWPGGLEGCISYTLQDARNAQTGKQLSNSPRHLPKFNLIVPLLRDKLFAGMDLQYLSGRKAIDNSRLGDAVIANITLFNRNLIKNLELSATVYNLLNQKFRDPGGEEHLLVGLRGIIQDGISFRMKLTYSF